MKIMSREYMVRHYEERTCKCGRFFYVPRKKRAGRRRCPGLRGMSAATCSTECSKERTRDRRLENSKNYRNQKKGVKNNGK